MCMNIIILIILFILISFNVLIMLSNRAKGIILW